MNESEKTANNTNGVSALQEPRLYLLPIADIKPRGWLKNQLRIQARGLSGHLDEFWPSVMDSKWFGGSLPDTERAPYWLDGVVPLAWQLDDDALKAKVIKRVESILERQHDDGWIGPRDETESNLDRSRANDVWTVKRKAVNERSLAPIRQFFDAAAEEDDDQL